MKKPYLQGLLQASVLALTITYFAFADDITGQIQNSGPFPPPPPPHEGPAPIIHCPPHCPGPPPHEGPPPPQHFCPPRPRPNVSGNGIFYQAFCSTAAYDSALDKQMSGDINLKLDVQDVTAVKTVLTVDGRSFSNSSPYNYSSSSDQCARETKRASSFVDEASGLIVTVETNEIQKVVGGQCSAPSKNSSALVTTKDSTGNTNQYSLNCEFLYY